MSEAAEAAPSPGSAWQPFTFGGLAAFSRARLTRLLVVELIAAVVVGLSAVWFLHASYGPVILQAIQEMPDTARIDRGRLTGVGTDIIAESKFLAIAITPEANSQIGQSADLQVQFRHTNFRVCAVLRPNWGMEFDYVPGVSIDLGRSRLEPWWGAWHPVIYVTAGLLVILLLFGIWALLAVIYTLPAKFIAWFTDRDLSWGGAWRMCCAAHISGALVMIMATFLYNWRAIDLVGLLFFFVAHLVVDWVYVIGGAWACPKGNVLKPNQNPFTA
jgi:hypothetical protein